VALACSVIPALRVGRIPLFSALREGGRGGTAGKAQHRVRGALVAAQIALALVVLAGAGLLVRTYERLAAVRPGFDATGVATLWLSLPAARYPGDTAVARFSAELHARVAALPGIEVAGLTSRLPLSLRGRNSSPIYPTDDASFAERVPPLQMFTTADAGYFEAMRIPIVAGRNFDRIDAQRGGEAIVSLPTAIQFWKDSTGRAAVGKQFRQLPGSGPVYTVVGVVGGVRDTSLAGPPVQSVYYPQVLEGDSDFSQIRRTIAIVARGSADANVIARSVQGAIRELDPTLPAFDVRPMEGVLRASRARLSFIIVVLGAAAVVTLLLGAVGLYGVMAYLVTLRTRELGVRIALGAQPRAVAGMMTRQGLTLTAVGVVAGLLLFAVVARFLQSFLFGVATMDPLTLAAASLTLVGIAALASWIPARRASRVDPASSLRAE
jgi:predicted permease